jgi:hypothetical protein
MTHLYGASTPVGSRRNTHLANLRAAGVAEQAIRDGLIVGERAAEQVIAMRAGDGSAGVKVCTDDFAFGRYRMDRWTPGASVDCLGALWFQVKPFAMISASQFRQVGPPPFDSREYAQAVNEVKRLGDRRRYDPASYPDGRLPDDVFHDKCTAFFWAAKGLNADSAKNDRGTSTPVGCWNDIAYDVAQRRDLSVDEAARLFALLNAAQADAGIAAWDMKYHGYLWRPIHAIRLAADAAPASGQPSGGVPPIEPDPNWLPLIPTSNHPEYPSGHSTFSGAAARVMARFFGTDAIAFTCTGDDALIDPRTGQKEIRTFPGFWAAAEEAGRSRILGGIHYTFSNNDGLRAGKSIGDHVFDHVLTPSGERPSAAVIGGKSDVN